MADDPSAPPILIALDLERARQYAARAGWEVADVIRTSPPHTEPTGPLRVIGQRAVPPRALRLVVSSSVTLEPGRTPPAVGSSRPDPTEPHGTAPQRD